MESELSDFVGELRGLLNGYLALRTATDIDARHRWVRAVQDFVTKRRVLGAQLPPVAQISGSLTQPRGTWQQLEYWATDGRSLTSLQPASFAEVSGWLNALYDWSRHVSPATTASQPAALVTASPTTKKQFVVISADGTKHVTGDEYASVLQDGRAGKFDIFMNAMTGEHGWCREGTFELRATPDVRLSESMLTMFLGIVMAGTPQRADELLQLNKLDDPVQTFREGRRRFEPDSVGGTYQVWPTLRDRYGFAPHVPDSPLRPTTWVFVVDIELFDEIEASRKLQSSKRNTRKNNRLTRP